MRRNKLECELCKEKTLNPTIWVLTHLGFNNLKVCESCSLSLENFILNESK